MSVERAATTRSDKRPGQSEHSGRWLVGGFALAVIAIVVYFAMGMPGMDHSAGASTPGMDMGSASLEHQVVDPGEFAAALDDPDAFVVNVHVPYEGEIEGTNLLIPFNSLDASLLPSDRSTQLLVYCMSGNMSASAVTELIAFGYTKVIELDGGMQAWRASGRPLTNSMP